MKQRLALRVFWMSILLISQGSFAAVYCRSIPAVEVDALLEFKENYISKGSQHVLQSWNRGNTSSVCGSWVGAACTRSGHHIQGLNLTGLGLEGKLAPHLWNLSFLSRLDLSFNSFTGSIPTHPMGYTSLKVLELQSNRLTGPIPSSLISLPALQELNLCNNSLSGRIPSPLNLSSSFIAALALCLNALTGSIPPDLFLHLPKLQYLQLWGNNLTGAIPPSVGNCTSLTQLDLYSNQLSGPIPAELSQLHNLQLALLSLNNLTGAIPPSLGNCTNLIRLELHFNQLTGPIPTQLGLLGDAKIISLAGNNLMGAIPPSLGNCTSLNVLQLTYNRLSGVIPMELGRLGMNVKILRLPVNNFTGIIPSSFGNCTSLVDLELAYNQLSGAIPAQLTMLSQLESLLLAENHLSGSFDISNFTKLEQLWLYSNELSGSLLPTYFSKVQQLQVLNLSNNYLTGDIPWDSLTNCSRLFKLDLSYNQFNGGIPSTLGKLENLQFLYLQGNLLQGEIPKSADFNNLRLLDVVLSFNHLNGSLPSSLAPALATLEFTLDLSHNDFSGSLPLWLGQLVKVTSIILSNNNFTGGIPQSLGDCFNLATLSLSQNHLFGYLPLEIGNLAYLESLDLSYNNLSGVLPSFLGTRLLHLQLLNVSFNNFTGPIPTDEGVFRHLNASCFQGNPHLCGPVLKKECIGPLQGQQQHHHSLLVQLRNWKGVLLITMVLLVLLIGLILILLVAQCNCLSQPAKDMANKLLTRSLVEANRYSAKVLMEATQGYSEVNILGQGGLGVVYKGVLSDGKIVAVKKLKDMYNGSHEELLREMQILGKLRHRNLVQILGCVLNLDTKALVLEHMANGSLEHYLDIHQLEHINESGQKEINRSSHWEMVTRVAMGIAHALAYLHHEYGASIIHGDVKPSNILLDSDMEPHLADFGLAKLIERGAEAASLTSDFKGSIGYMAPEYAYAARITTKVDVYSYGVVLLRMLTGRSPVQVVPSGLSLHEWVKSKLAALEGGDLANWEELLDAALVQKSLPLHVSTGSSSHNQQHLAVQLLRMCVSCTAQHPDDRPTIQEVIAFLTSKEEILQLSHS